MLLKWNAEKESVERRGLTDSSYAFSAMVAASSVHPFFVALSAFSLVSPLLKRPYFEGGSTSTIRKSDGWMRRIAAEVLV